ncbi:uncharacterized protein LOC143290424 [Babylonia areolata]|uniref:uncharacterized protein LOC143290424 n=1 Tax=Babylonia areolata TaxID=304850 RepID=UPI003FD01740
MTVANKPLQQHLCIQLPRYRHPGNREICYTSQTETKQKKDVSSKQTLQLKWKEHVSETGKTVPAKTMRGVDCSKCCFSCSKISESDFCFNVGGQRTHMCKKFFLATLSVSEAFVDHALKRSQHGIFKGGDQLRQKTPHNKTPQEQIKQVRAYI